jgi:hypothetical protein
MGLFGTETKRRDYYDSISGPEMESLLKDSGFSCELTSDSRGEPMIKFYVESFRSLIFFYKVEGGRAQSIQFFAGFSAKPPVDQVNQWNRQKRFGRAYLDKDNDVCLEMDVDLEGGVRPEYIGEALRTWRALLVTFVGFMR